MADRTPPPACISLETLTAKRAGIYFHVPPLGTPIPIEVAPFPVDDHIPGEKEIDEAVLRISLNRARRLSVMRAEHLILWLCAKNREEHHDPGNW